MINRTYKLTRERILSGMNIAVCAIIGTILAAAIACGGSETVVQTVVVRKGSYQRG